MVEISLSLCLACLGNNLVHMVVMGLEMEAGAGDGDGRPVLSGPGTCRCNGEGSLEEDFEREGGVQHDEVGQTHA